MPGLSLTTLARTAVCLCYVVVLHKHCQTRVHTYLYTQTHRACLFLCFGQEQSEPLWSGGVQEHMLSVYVQLSCGLPCSSLTQYTIQLLSCITSLQNVPLRY